MVFKKRANPLSSGYQLRKTMEKKGWQRVWSVLPNCRFLIPMKGSYSFLWIIIAHKGNAFIPKLILGDDLKEWVRPLQFLLTVGWYVALSLIIPVAIGYWLDHPRMLDKSPLFTFIGLGLGSVIAFVGLIRMLLRFQAEQEELRKSKEGKKSNGAKSS